MSTFYYLLFNTLLSGECIVMFCQDLCWQKHCGFSGFFKFLLWFAVRVLSKMTRADKSWNIFPTAQRFQFFTNSVDSHINMRTICGRVNHRTVSHDAQNLLSTVLITKTTDYTPWYNYKMFNSILFIILY